VSVIVFIWAFHDLSVLENPSSSKSPIFMQIRRIYVVYRDYLGISDFQCFEKSNLLKIAHFRTK